MSRRDPHQFVSVSDQVVAILRDADGPLSAPEISRSIGYVYALPHGHGDDTCWRPEDRLGRKCRLTFAEHLCEGWDVLARRGHPSGSLREEVLVPLLRCGVVERLGSGRQLRWRLAAGAGATIDMAEFEDVLREAN